MGYKLFQDLYRSLLILLPFTTEYTYDNPEKWPLSFPQCGGNRQSPISIYNHKSIPVQLPTLLFGYYNTLFADNLRLHNNGHTVELEIPATEAGIKPYITGGPLADVYIVEGVHFHWGSPKYRGSEHKLNGRFYDIEMHIVHRNRKYPTLTNARQFKDGIAVIAVLFKAVKSSNVYFPGLNILYDALPRVSAFNASTRLDNRIALASLMGNANYEDYFTYSGSLTTPPCSESVTWIVMSSVVPISHFDLPKFWDIYDSRQRKLLNNFRPLQKLNNRRVYHQTPNIQYYILS